MQWNVIYICYSTKCQMSQSPICHIMGKKFKEVDMKSAPIWTVIDNFVKYSIWHSLFYILFFDSDSCLQILAIVFVQTWFDIPLAAFSFGVLDHESPFDCHVWNDVYANVFDQSIKFSWWLAVKILAKKNPDVHCIVKLKYNLSKKYWYIQTLKCRYWESLASIAWNQAQKISHFY